MARTVLSALRVRDELRQVRERVAALDLDSRPILAAIDEADRVEEAAAGAAVWPPDAEQSLLIDHGGQRLRFSRKSGRFEVVSLVDPATVLIESPGGNGGGTAVPNPPAPVPNPVGVNGGDMIQSPGPPVTVMGEDGTIKTEYDDVI